MPRPVVYVNNVEVAVANLAELNTDYRWQPNSPMPVPELPDSLELMATNDRYDGYNVVNLWIQQRGVVNGIPVRIVDDYGEEIFNGFGDFGDERTMVNRAQRVWVLALKDTNFTFTELCEGLNLHRFSPFTLPNVQLPTGQQVVNTPQPWQPAVPYRKATLVLFQNKIYIARVNNTGKQPDIFDAAWLFVSDAPLPNAFTFADFRQVYYIKSAVPNDAQAIATAITIYILLTELYRQIKYLADGANPLTPNQAISTIIYIAAQIVALVTLFDSLSDTLFTKPKLYNAVNIRELLTRAFASIGYAFSSSILDGNYRHACYIDQTTRAGKTRNPDNNPVPDMPLMQFMEHLAGIFGAKFKPDTDRKEVRFERADVFWDATTQTELPLMQDGVQESYNLSELFASWKMTWTKDDIETNTHTGKVETSCTVHYTIQNIVNRTQLGLRNTHEVSIPFARGIRKVGSTVLEDVLNALYDIFVLLSGGNTTGSLGNRTNMMLLNADFIGIPKLIILQPTGRLLSENNDTYLNPSYLYTEFHRVSSVMNNQWILCRQESEVPLFPQRTVKRLRNNNVVRRADGKKCLLNSLRRDLDTGLHTLEYRIRQTYIPQSQITETIMPTY